MPIKLVVFDAYGTLFDVASAARRAGEADDGGKLAGLWPQLAEDWRRKQLEYSWHRAITGDHADFWAVTGDGLDWALAAHGLGREPGLRDRLMDLYATLDAYPEVGQTLDGLRDQSIKAAILSNGSPNMLDAAVRSAGIADRLDAVLSVEEVGVFKPAPQVYELACTRFGVARDEVLFVSSNGWDIAGAARFGFFTAWVNRAGAPMDRLGHPPHEEFRDLGMIAMLAGAI